MTLARFVFVLVLVLVGGVSRADEPPGPPSRIDQAARFAELVREGDRARAAGRTSAAVQAYSEALRIRDDPAIVGRLGLVALEGGATAEAVSYLLRAIIDGHDVPPAERRRIQDAYERARPQVCRVDVALSHLGADVLIDGELERASSTAGEFYVFTSPGRHEVRATLGGFQDAIETIDAPKGGRVRVSLVLTPLPAPSPPPAPEAPATSKPASPAPSSPCPAPSSKPPAPRSPARRWSPSFGATVLYGPVSPLPSFGVVASSDWPLGEVFSWRLDLRGAFSPRDEGNAVRGALIGAWPGACGTVRWFSGCLLAAGGALHRSRITPRTPAFSEWHRFLGFGAGAMAAIPLGPLNVRILLDAVVLIDDYPLVAGGGPAGWSGNQIMAGLSIMAAMR
ncbi:tetratricopeptide repeat protein [Polyangium fumosum]|uniref:PEGA domain-containing protein n=1 Tax=Polyangium fumosum TaxID=889272 RepID=A0A4U1JDV9_9BACT|nr:hypothetical protein [Polyangium fumosum]TKD09159.1 hypothetical protein E8A74_12800 [Polyangium fumosum]